MAISQTDVHRLTLRIHEDTFKQLEYWATRKGISVNEYVEEAVDKAIRYENKDYDLPTLETARLNQLIDVITALVSDTHSLQEIVVNGFDSLLQLTRGDNYLLNAEDGDL